MIDQEKTGVLLQEIKIKGRHATRKVREVIKEGNARRVIVRSKKRTVLDIPLTVGVGGAAAMALLLPTLTAIGVIAAWATDVSVIIEQDISSEEEAKRGGAENYPQKRTRRAATGMLRRRSRGRGAARWHRQSHACGAFAYAERVGWRHSPLQVRELSAHGRLQVSRSL